MIITHNDTESNYGDRGQGNNDDVIDAEYEISIHIPLIKRALSLKATLLGRQLVRGEAPDVSNRGLI